MINHIRKLIQLISDKVTTWHYHFVYNRSRKDALVRAQTRLSEDGSPTLPYDLVRKIGRHRLEKGAQ